MEFVTIKTCGIDGNIFGMTPTIEPIRMLTDMSIRYPVVCGISSDSTTMQIGKDMNDQQDWIMYGTVIGKITGTIIGLIIQSVVIFLNFPVMKILCGDVFGTTDIFLLTMETTRTMLIRIIGEMIGMMIFATTGIIMWMVGHVMAMKIAINDIKHGSTHLPMNGKPIGIIIGARIGRPIFTNIPTVRNGLRTGGMIRPLLTSAVSGKCRGSIGGI